MSYVYLTQDGQLVKTSNHKLACLAALHGTYGSAIPDKGKAGIIVVHDDGKRHWQTITAKAVRC